MSTVHCLPPVGAVGLAAIVGAVPIEIHGPLPDGTLRVTAEGVDEQTLGAAIDAHDPDMTEETP